MKPVVGACVLSLVAAAGAAKAECPTGPQDLDAGITLGFEDGSVTQLVREADGMIVERTEYNDGSGAGFFSRSKFGFAYLEIYDTLNGEPLPDARAGFDYGPAGLDLVDVPKTEITRYTLERTISFADGTNATERVTFETREFEQRDWGGCAYRVLPVEVSDFDADDGRAEVFDYLPDLGVAVFIGASEWDELVSGAEPASIEKGLAPTP